MPASAFSAVRTAPPATWEAFENGTATLWALILNDEGVQRFGRGGQEQYGIDVWGYRNKDPEQLVAIQCKCKGEGKQATVEELRADVEKALAQFPDLSEYYFTTTAPNHGPLQIEAHKITKEQSAAGRRVVVRVMGWGNLLEKIAAFPEAALAFDPAYSPFIEQLAQQQSAEHERIESAVGQVSSSVFELSAKLDILVMRTDSVSQSANAAELQIDQEIDRYRDLANEGDPRVAIGLFKTLLDELTSANSGRIWFRVKANIGHCYLTLDNREEAARWLDEAVAHAPDDQKAIANRILALILREQHSDALQVALAELEQGSENEVVAAYAVQAAGLSGTPDALHLVPTRFHETEGVLKYHLNNLRGVADQRWKEIARDGLARTPGDDFFRRQAADADIDDVLDGRLRYGFRLTDEQRLVVLHATEELIALWNKSQERGLGDRPENLALNCNACVALIALGDSERAGTLVREGLAAAGGLDEDMILRAGAIAFELDDSALASEVFPLLGMEGPALLVRCQIAARKGDWPFLEGLVGDERLLTVPEPDRKPIQALVATADVRRRAASEAPAAKTDLTKLVEEFADSPRALVLIGQGANELHWSDIGDLAYAAALAAIGPETHFVSRATLAHHAMRRDDFRNVVKLLDGVVDLETPSDELLTLAAAHAYSFPSLESGQRFLEALPTWLRNEEPLAIFEGIYHYHRGDLLSALLRFEQARISAPDRLRYLLLMVQVHLRSRRKHEVVKLLADVDPALFSGSAAEKMELAHLLNMVGRRDDALELGYTTLEANRNDPAINLKFVGLTFSNAKRLLELSAAPVGVGMWTKLTSDDGQSREFHVVNGKSDPVHARFGTEHPLARGAVGLSAGQSFEVLDDLERSTRWTVAEVRHRYLDAHHDITENFDTRFPGHGGFYVIRTQGDDIQPMLDLLRHQGERRDRLLNSYGNGNVPISVIVDIAGGNQISFADSLRFHGLPIDTCRGDHAERIHALQAVEDARGQGAVFDSLTHWAVVGMDATDVLQAVFGKLYVTQSTADDLTELVRYEPFDEEMESGTTYYKDGRFYYDENTPDRVASREDAINARLSTLGQQYAVLPASAPDDLDPNFSEHLSGSALYPIFAARAGGHLLISDDRPYRDWAQHLKARSAWLQAVFRYARAAGLIDNDRYTKLTAALAAHRHLPVAVDAQALVAATAFPESSCELEALADCVGSEKAEMASHLSVFSEAVARLWSVKPMLPRARQATSLLMRKLLRFRPEVEGEVLGIFRRTLTRYDGGDEYFQRWKIGHFINDATTDSLSRPHRRDRSRRRRRSARRARA